MALAKSLHVPVEVIEENASQPTALPTMLDQEVVIAPLLVLCEILGVMLVTHLKKQCNQTKVMLGLNFAPLKQRRTLPLLPTALVPTKVAGSAAGVIKCVCTQCCSQT